MAEPASLVGSVLESLFSQGNSASDPESQRYVALRRKFAEGKAQDQARKRAADAGVQDILLDDTIASYKASVERAEKVQQRIDLAVSSLQGAPPQLQQPRLNEGELMAGALTAIVNPSMLPQALTALSVAASQRNEVEFDNALRAYGLNRESAKMAVEELMGQLGHERATQRTLQGRAFDIEDAKIERAQLLADKAELRDYNERRDDIEYRRENANALNQRLSLAKIPAEYRRIAAVLNARAKEFPQEYGAFAIPDSEVEFGAQQLAEKAIKDWNDDINRKAGAFGYIDKTQEADLRKSATELARVFGVSADRFVIPTAKTVGWKRLEESVRHNVATEAEARRYHDLLDAAAKKRLENDAERIAIARGHLGVAIDRESRIAAENARKLAAGGLPEAQKAFDAAKAKEDKAALLVRELRDRGNVDDRTLQAAINAYEKARAERIFAGGALGEYQEIKDETERILGALWGRPSDGPTGSTVATPNTPPGWKVEN